MWRLIRIAIPLVAVAGLAATLVTPRGTDAATASDLTRAELAGLYRSLMPSGFQPPACVLGHERFTDVPASSPFCPWIEEMARRGITSGCTATEYCPGNPVNRAQMAVFVVKATETCPTLDPKDEMIRVGGVCIDKYEASIWDQPVGGNQITNDMNIPCLANGQNCTNIYARSVAGVHPRRNITWFQAQAALRNSGKRLPTNAEWQMAALGTPDPGETPGSEGCNTASTGQGMTGERDNCVSSSGVFDMVGNLTEWVADWGDRASACTHWPSTYGDDHSCVGLGDGEANGHLPGAMLRGGDFTFGPLAGPFTVSSVFPPSASISVVGFRGAR